MKNLIHHIISIILLAALVLGFSSAFAEQPEAQSVEIWNEDRSVNITVADVDNPGDPYEIPAAEYQLHAVALPEEAMQEFYWFSEDEETAVVDQGSGKVTFKKAGTPVFIYAAVEDESDTTGVTYLVYVPATKADSVTITDANGTNITGQTVKINTTSYQLKASVSPAAASQNVTWNSSDNGTAGVDSSGKVTFAKAGTVTVTATAADGSNKSASMTLTYVPLATGVTITDANGTNITGQTVKIKTASYKLKAAASPAEAAQNFTLTSSDTTIAAVDGNGNVTFAKGGTVTITATAADGSNKSASMTLTYVPLTTKVIIRDENGNDVTEQKITTDKVEYQLSADFEPKEAEPNLTWRLSKTSDPEIGNVDELHRVVFKKRGSVIIYVESHDGSEIKVGVKVTIDVKGTKLIIRNPSGKNVNGKTITTKEKSIQLKGEVVPANFAYQNIQWVCNNSKIAAVKQGKVTFKQAGSVLITAIAKDGTGVSNSVTVKTDIKATKVKIKNDKDRVVNQRTITSKSRIVNLSAVAQPELFASQRFAWTSSNQNIAVVKQGKVTFRKEGTVKITATTRDGSKKSGWVKITYKPLKKNVTEYEIIETPLAEPLTIWTEPYLETGPGLYNVPVPGFDR